MAIKQIWGKLLNGSSLLFEGELFIHESDGFAATWSLTFAATQELYELIVAGPITVELVDGRRGNALVVHPGSRQFEHFVKLEGSEPLQ